MREAVKLAVLKGVSQFCRLPVPLDRLRIQDKFFYKLRPRRTQVSMSIGSLSISLDLEDFTERRIFFREYEREIVRFLKATVRPGWNCLDVGANIGYLSIVTASRVGSAGRVFSFEPAPLAFERLRVNADHSGGIIQPYQLAVSDAPRELEFFASAKEHVLSTSIVALRPKDSNVITVPAVTLDDFCKREGISPALIKIDIEGGELAALRGMRETLERDRPIIVCEFKPAVAPSETETALNELVGLGYSIREWRGGRLVGCSPAEVASQTGDVNAVLL